MVLVYPVCVGICFSFIKIILVLVVAYIKLHVLDTIIWHSLYQDLIVRGEYWLFVLHHVLMTRDLERWQGREGRVYIGVIRKSDFIAAVKRNLGLIHGMLMSVAFHVHQILFKSNPHINTLYSSWRIKFSISGTRRVYRSASVISMTTMN